MSRTAVAYRMDEAGGTLARAAAVAQGGLEVVAAVGDEGSVERGGLARAFEQIASGEASTLLTPRLGALAGSLQELLALLDWLEAARAYLVAIDVGLDTASRAGARVVKVLRELDRLEREPDPGRPSRGRPGLAAHSPELAGRINEMRERGLSLQAIADALDAERVPTPRGGSRWRPSSVQAVLGYRRPPPPAGAPPPGPAPRPRPAAPRPGGAPDVPRPGLSAAAPRPRPRP